ncbi:MAG: amidohydrolase [bacterium]
MKKIHCLAFFLFILFMAGFSIFLVCTPEKPAADLILKNGTFFTVDENNPHAQAVVIKNERILFVGKDNQALEYADIYTEIIDLKGKFGCPGFNDANIKLFTYAKFNNALDFSEVTTTLEIQKKVLKRIRENNNYDDWVIAWGWDHTKLNLTDWPDRRILDRIAPFVPIIVFNDDGHIAFANSKTLQIARIWASTSDPPGGKILKNQRTGNTTGILKERAMDFVLQYLPEIPDTTIIESINEQLQKAVQFGITTLQDKSSVEIIPFIKKLQEQNHYNCRISLAFPLKKDISEYVTLKDNFQNNNIYINPLTVAIDGSIKSRTAMLSAPYSDKPSTNGISQISFEKLSDLIIFADQNNLLIELHASGDAAVQKAIEAFELAYTVNKIKNRRFRLEGIEIINPAIIKSLKDLNLITVMNPSRCMDAVRWMNKTVGIGRTRFAYPFASIHKTGTKIAFGSGHPYGILNPLYGIYAAVTRKDTSGHPLHGWIPEERLTIKEAIKAYTLGSAYAELKEDEKGSLKAGKLADIVILDKNILQIPYKDILDTQVIYTVKGGKVIYKHSNHQ